MNKKKLLFVNVNQFGYSAGHYFYCKYLRDHFEIYYISFDRGRKKINLDDVFVKYVNFEHSKSYRVYLFIRTVVQECKNIKPDILFVVYFRVSFIISLFCKANLKILDIRTGALNKNLFKRKIENIYIRGQSFFFRKIMILSENLRKLLSIQLSKTSIVPLGAEIFYTGNHDYSTPNLLYVGTLNNRKIYETIEGLFLFISKHPDYYRKVKYTIIGFGSVQEELEIKNTILKFELNSIVQFLGRKSYNELPKYFENTNIGICYVPQTPFYDVQPATKIFEYSLSGLITISTKTKENMLYIFKENGVLCEDNPQSFCDALECITSNYTIYSTKIIRASLLNFTWEKIVKEVLVPTLEI